MKILVTARYISGSPYEGGSSRFMKCVIDSLSDMGHEVIATTSPDPDQDYDLIIVSHKEQFDDIKNHKADKIYVSHGLIIDEYLNQGNARFVSISEEVRRNNLEQTGIDSVVIGQPIKILDRVEPSKILNKILIIRQTIIEPDPFEFLFDKYEVKISDPDTPIEDQIKWADLCITLGRGALESMAQGKPVLVADNRLYMGPLGDGYIDHNNIREIARCNFSGRRYKHKLTQEWIEKELSKYNSEDSEVLYDYVKENHSAKKIIERYLYSPDVGFGVMINDAFRFNTILKKSALPGQVHYVINPESATKGLNELLDEISRDASEIAILAHQDMYFRQGWLEKVQDQLTMLPDDWVIAGVVGKDMQGRICGNIHDMRMVDHINTIDIHEFPEYASCLDECVLIINMKSGFRFDESLDGFDLYGTLCVLQAWENGGSAWVINAFCEHYCSRPFTWFPDDNFAVRYKQLYNRFNDKYDVIESTVFVNKPIFETSAQP